MTHSGPISVASRAHRTLRDIPRFKFSAAAKSIPLPKSEALSEHGELIGVYENPPGVDPTLVVVTSHALGCIGSTHRRWVAFGDIAATRVPSEKLVDDSITLILRSGVEIDVRIAGGDDRFRDIFSFVRFLDRVVADRLGVDG